MARKRPKPEIRNKSDMTETTPVSLIDRNDRPVTVSEFEQAINALREELTDKTASRDRSAMPELCPMTPTEKKKKVGKRQKLSTTVDQVLFDMMHQRVDEGVPLSRLLDSALWHFFGKPRLSFETERTEKTD
jgi:hypothetical protein